MPPATGVPSAPRSRLEHALPWLLLAAVAAAFLNGIPGPFLFDDARFGMEDPPGFWMRPVLWGTVLANRWLPPDGPLDYHLVNLGIHALSGLVLFGLLRRTLAFTEFFRQEELHGRGAWGNPRERRLFSFAVALVWLVHPLQTESVTYLSGRSESLAGLAYLGTLYAFARAADSRVMESPRPRAWLGLAWGSFALGMGVKEVLATAPVLVWLYDRTFLSRTFAQALRRRRGFYAALFLTDLVLAAALIGPQLVEENSVAGFGVAAFGPWDYLKTQAGVIVHYLGLCAWPADLCLDYLWPAAGEARQFVPQGLLVAGLLGATAIGLVRGARLAFLGAWFFVILAPTSSFVPQQDAACERRMYLPLAAVVTLVLLGVWRLAHRFAGARRLPLALGVSLLAAVALSAGTIGRNRTYHSALVMWQDVVARSPHNWRAYLHLGTLLSDEGRLAEAVEPLERSIVLGPRPNTLLLLGNVRFALRDLAAAVAAYDGADLMRPDHAETLLRRGIARLELGDLERGRADLERSARLAPSLLARLHLGADALRRAAGEAPAEAERHFRAALELAPGDAQARAGLGRALLQAERHAEALAELERALEDRPDDPALHTLIGTCLLALGRAEEAVEPFRKALTIGPDSSEAHLLLGQALGALARHDEAVRELRQALAVAPDQPQALELLARSLLARPADGPAARSEALAAALRAAELTHHARPRILETLAAAQAANGELARAGETLERAIALVPPADEELRLRLVARRAAYADAQRQPTAAPR